MKYTPIANVLITCITAASATGTRNISIENSVFLYMMVYYIDFYDCLEVEAHWKIQRADGETELYTVLMKLTHMEDMRNYKTEGWILMCYMI